MKLESIKNIEDLSKLSKDYVAKLSDEEIEKILKNIYVQQLRTFNPYEGTEGKKKFAVMLAYDVKMYFNNLLSTEKIKEIANNRLIEASMNVEYMGKQIVPYNISKRIMEDQNLITLDDSGYIYKYNGKCYEQLKDKELDLLVTNNILRDNYKTSKNVNEVKFHLGTLCGKKYRDFIQYDNGDKYIALNNVLYNVSQLRQEPFSPNKITKTYIDVEYDENFDIEERMKNSSFKKYLDTTFKHDKTTILNVQEVLGACLLPNPKKMQKAILLLGEGSNGKSVFMNIIKKVIGENNISTMKLQDICVPFSFAQMYGKQVNIDADASGTILNDNMTSIFKAVTAGDSVQINGKFEKPFSVELNNLLVVSLNKMPASSDKSHGFLRRQFILTFEQEFASASEIENNPAKKNALPIDEDLEKKLFENELDLIFMFALEGLKRLIKNNYKFTLNDKINENIENYKRDNDALYDFFHQQGLDECIKVVSANHVQLLDIFKIWSNGKGDKYQAQTMSKELLTMFKNGEVKLVTRKDNPAKPAKSNNKYTAVDIIIPKGAVDEYNNRIDNPCSGLKGKKIIYEL